MLSFNFLRLFPWKESFIAFSLSLSYVVSEMIRTREAPRLLSIMICVAKYFANLLLSISIEVCREFIIKSHISRLMQSDHIIPNSNYVRCVISFV